MNAVKLFLFFFAVLIEIGGSCKIKVKILDEFRDSRAILHPDWKIQIECQGGQLNLIGKEKRIGVEDFGKSCRQKEQKMGNPSIAVLTMECDVKKLVEMEIKEFSCTCGSVGNANFNFSSLSNTRLCGQEECRKKAICWETKRIQEWTSCQNKRWTNRKISYNHCDQKNQSTDRRCFKEYTLFQEGDQMENGTFCSSPVALHREKYEGFVLEMWTKADKYTACRKRCYEHSKCLAWRFENSKGSNACTLLRSPIWKTVAKANSWSGRVPIEKAFWENKYEVGEGIPLKPDGTVIFKPFQHLCKNRTEISCTLATVTAPFLEASQIDVEGNCLDGWAVGGDQIQGLHYKSRLHCRAKQRVDLNSSMTVLWFYDLLQIVPEISCDASKSIATCTWPKWLNMKNTEIDIANDRIANCTHVERLCHPKIKFIKVHGSKKCPLESDSDIVAILISFFLITLLIGIFIAMSIFLMKRHRTHQLDQLRPLVKDYSPSENTEEILWGPTGTNFPKPGIDHIETGEKNYRAAADRQAKHFQRGESQLHGTFSNEDKYDKDIQIVLDPTNSSPLPTLCDKGNPANHPKFVDDDVARRALFKEVRKQLEMEERSSILSDTQGTTRTPATTMMTNLITAAPSKFQEPDAPVDTEALHDTWISTSSSSE